MNERILDKLDKIEEKIANIDKTLERNTISLEFHILRTSQNEELIKALRADLKPVENHVNNLQGVLKGLGVLALVLSIVGGAIKLFT